MALDTDRNWNVSQNPPGTNQFDVLSVATHEAGHMFGFHNHFTTFIDCPQTTAAQTMCAVIGAGGSTWRTLAGHDIHTYEAAYGL